MRPPSPLFTKKKKTTTAVRRAVTMSMATKLRFTIYVSLLFSMMVVSYWYNHRAISLTLVHHPEWNQMVFTMTRSTTTTTAATNSGLTIFPVPVESPPLPTPSPTLSTKEDPMDVGILSSLPDSFFRDLQTEIDEREDPRTRCQRYGYDYPDAVATPPRRIFYGTLIADETLELLNIIAAETYQIYSGMVLVESNRTQSFVHTREWKHAIDSTNTDTPTTTNRRQEMVASLFGIEDVRQVRIKPFINEDETLRTLYREHKQRDLIIEGWKELGMQPNDIGILADLDETFTRDYLRAIQTCRDIPQFQYERHYCHPESVKIVARTRVYETSPQCRTRDRYWFHPDIILGYCIEGIGNEKLHPSAPRESATSFLRAPGFGQHCDDWHNITNSNITHYPLWNAADFRRTCSGGRHAFLKNSTLLERKVSSDQHTAYHFHNFFIHMNTTRYKYFSYGHADNKVYQKPIYNMSEDLQMMYNCVNNITDAKDQKWKRSLTLDLDHLNPRQEPIYFMDRQYRQRRHDHVHDIVKADDEMLARVRSYHAAVTATFTPHTATAPSKAFRPFLDLVNDHDESIHATVMAMASNYDLGTYQRFVGSLRYSGYQGHIIIGLEPNPKPEIVKYLLEKNVTIKTLSWVNCTYMRMDDDSNQTDIFKETTCADPYPDIKIRWSRFPMMRDWLMECITCNGPILMADARDLIFQRNPFDRDAPQVTGLQLYQEHANMTTKHWLTEWPIRECKGVTYDQPMLCSGTTVGTRETMLEYLTIMYEEMKVWINDPKCRFNINGDDQAIHNYLYYSGKFPKETTISVPNRMGGIVNTIGYEASVLKRQYLSSTHRDKYPGASRRTWISRTAFGLTNEDGLLVELDGITVSRVVHQWDRFGTPYEWWLNQQPWARF